MPGPTDPKERLFRFVSIRPPQKKTSTIVSDETSAFDLDKVDSSMLANIRSREALLYDSLVTAVGESEPHVALNAAADSFREGSFYHPDLASLERSFPGFDELAEMLHTDDGTGTVDGFKGAAESGWVFH